MLRIAFITPEYPGCGPAFGIGKYVADLVDGLRCRGHPVRVVVASDTGLFVEDAPERLRLVVHRRCGLLYRGLLFGWTIERLVERWRATIAEASNWGALTAFTRLSCPLIIRLSSSIVESDPKIPLRWSRWWLERRAVERAQVVIANSQAMAMACRQLYQRDVDYVVYHGWTGPIPCLDKRPSKVEALSFLFVGRCEYRKGIDILLQAWTLFQKQFPHATLHIVGASRDRPRLPGVVWHGVIDASELERVRRVCQVQVIPSRWESFGLVALEAWAFGLAVVASWCGALREVVGDAGILVRTEDPVAWADALQRACDPITRERLTRAGTERLLEKFSGKRWISLNEKIYQKIAASSKSSKWNTGRS
ncbi:MAG: glycosyltransferase family 4 protein [Planctomycetota bacterium]|nr:glycosyltransferase family 4 protein [Planctomycetota bacterium]MDW8373097.1 glycosyltransferase family 4 protein [Planctomycetota bacterium]